LNKLTALLHVHILYSVFCTHKCNVGVTDIYTECIMYFQVLHVFSASDSLTTLAQYKCIYLITYLLTF